jgi:mRNA interferase RelE/StbE
MWQIGLAWSSTMYDIRILDEAVRDLDGLDKPVARRILERIKWLAANMDEISPELLKGDLAGLYKFRIGDFRVIYQILQNENVVLVHQSGHRSAIYRKR